MSLYAVQQDNNAAQQAKADRQRQFRECVNANPGLLAAGFVFERDGELNFTADGMLYVGRALYASGDLTDDELRTITQAAGYLRQLEHEVAAVDRGEPDFSEFAEAVAARRRHSMH